MAQIYLHYIQNAFFEFEFHFGLLDSLTFPSLLHLELQDRPGPIVLVGNQSSTELNQFCYMLKEKYAVRSAATA